MSGRKAFSPTPDQRSLVKAMIGYGIPEDELCLTVINPTSKKAISPHTLRKYFREEIDTGTVTANAKVAQSLFRKATGEGPQSVTACIFWLKTRARWKETSALEVGNLGGESNALVIRLAEPMPKIAGQ